MSASAFIGPVNRSVNVDYAGSVISASLEKHYINVKNGASGTLAAGSVVVWDLTADDGYTVNTSTTQTQSPACVIESSCASGAKCLCQVWGKANVLFDGGGSPAAVAGARFFLSSTNAGYAGAISSPNGTQVAGGVFYDASSATESVEVFINAL